MSFYSYDRVCSYDGTINFIVGGRSIGKTYGKQIRVIKRAFKFGEEFVWVRRDKDELRTAINTFFDAVSDEFPGYFFRVVGNVAEGAKGIPENFALLPQGEQKEILKKVTFVTLGYFIALTQAQKFKGSAFPKVRTMVFDEFILEKGFRRYMPDEVNTFLNLYSTINRKRQGKDRVRAYLLANAVSLDNPYFIHYDIDPDEAVNGVIKKAKGFLIVDFPNMEDFRNEIYESGWGQFIAETDPEYAAYSIDNEFRDNHDLMLGDKDRAADYLYTIETRKGTFSVWSKMFSRTVFVQKKRPRGGERIFTLLPEKMGEGKVFLDRSSEVLSGLRTYWRHGNMLFDSPQTRNGMLDIFR